MSIFIWLAAGALLGWIAYAMLNMSPGRGQVASIVIGAIGGVIGGRELAPLFGFAAAAPDGFSGAALFVAMLAAAGLLLIGNYVYQTWEV